jgi:hypothetical protein
MERSELIIEYVKQTAASLNSEFRLTRNSVPCIICKGDNTTFSLVFAAKSGKWKAFYPWPAPDELQERIYFRDEEAMIDFMKKAGVKC